MALTATMNLANSWQLKTVKVKLQSPQLAVVKEKQTDAEAFSDEQLVKAILKNSGQHHFRMLVARYQSKVTPSHCLCWAPQGRRTRKTSPRKFS